MSDTPVKPRPLKPRCAEILSLSVHEFRTPLTVVNGYMRMLAVERFGPVTEQQRKLLKEIEKGCVRLTELLDEGSDLSNHEAGEAPFDRQPVDLHKVLRDAVDRLPPLPDRDVA